MRSKKKADTPRNTPVWLLSFGDMMTNLLTFFILAYAYSEEKTHRGYVEERIIAFRVSIETMGLPGLLPLDPYQVVSKHKKTTNYPIPRDKYEEESKSLDREIEPYLPTLDNVDVKKVTKKARLQIVVPFSFQQGKSTLTMDQRSFLESIADSLRKKGKKLLVEGHADQEGLSSIEEMRLAFRRAAAAVSYLHDSLGIPLQMLTPIIKQHVHKGPYGTHRYLVLIMEP